MEHLRAQFHEELDTDGEIVIAGEPFSRHQILNGLAPEPYRVAFTDWLERREERFLEKADEILGRYDNSDRFAQLKKTFSKGGLKPFIGAGLSMTSGFPGWTAFLYKLCDESHVTTADLKALLDTGQYEEAAELLSTNLGSGLFNENVQTTFARQRSPEGVINYLPRLFPKCSILTTNFDALIETLYRGDDVDGFDRVVSGKALGELGRQLADGARILVKLHGDCEQVADRVLLKSEYDLAYGDAAEVERFFNQVVFGGSLLFLGASLCADRTVKAMRQIVTKYGSHKLPRHYAFMELKTGDDRVQRKKELATANIFPIWYPEKQHEESLEALFLKMVEPE
jgi:hypothetical protein